MTSPKNKPVKSKSKSAPRPKSAPPESAMQKVMTRLHTCQATSCRSERAAARVISAENHAKLANIRDGKRSIAQMKRMSSNLMVRAVSGKPQVALARCSVAKCKPALEASHAVMVDQACKIARKKDPRAKCIVPPKGKGLTTEASIRCSRASVKQVMDTL